MSRPYILFLFLLLASVNSQPTASRAEVPSQCLTRFFNERSYFKPCLENVCFIFLQQIPFVRIDPSMTAEKDQILFPCKNLTQKYPKLEGKSFDIHKKIDYNGLCVWGGPKCTFTEMTNFVRDRRLDSATMKYQFGIQGMVAHLPDELSSFIRISATIRNDPIIILKSNQDSKSNVAASFHQVFRGFESGTWLSLGITLLCLILVACIVSYVFDGSFSPTKILMNVTCEAAFEETTKAVTKRNQIRRSSISLIGIAFSGFTLITILFYEISIVNFIFNDKAEKLSKPLHEFNPQELSAFGELPGTLSETSLIEATGNAGTRFLNKSFPWNRCHSWDACYKKLLDPKDAMKYMIAFEPESMYEIQNRKACSLVTVLDVKGFVPPLKGASGAPHGWYLSTAVPESKYLKLNQEILKIKLNGALDGIMDVSTKASGCGEKKLTISPPILVIPLSLLIGPIIIIILIVIGRKAQLASQERNKGDNPKDYEDYNQTMAMAT